MVSAGAFFYFDLALWCGLEDAAWMAEPSVPERIFSSLSKGKDEPYFFSKESLEQVEALLKSLRGADESVAKDVFRVAYVLDRKLSSPQTARTLLNMALRFFDVDQTYRTPKKGPVSEGEWRRLLGNERELPKEPAAGGKKLWDILKS